MADRIVVMSKGRIEQLGTPLEIYNRPATQFVAGFFGTPTMNFLEGTVEVERRRRAASAARASSSRCPTRVPAELAGRKVVLGVRSEHVLVGDDAARPPARPDSPSRSATRRSCISTVGRASAWSPRSDRQRRSSQAAC